MTRFLHVDCSRHSVPLLMGLVLALRLPLSGAAQDTLQQLHDTSRISIQLQGAPVRQDREGEVSYTFSSGPIGMSNFRSVGLMDGFDESAFEGAPLTWAGRQFSMSYQNSRDNGDTYSWSFQGEVSADGQSVERLVAQEDVRYCIGAGVCTTPTDQDTFSIDLRGPVPFSEMEDLSAWGEQGWCLNYSLGGEEIAGTIEQIAYSSSTQGFLETLDYPNSAGDQPAELLISFCSSGEPPEAPTPVPTGLIWEFAGSNLFTPEDTYGFSLAAYNDQMDGHLTALHDATRSDPSNLVLEGRRLLNPVNPGDPTSEVVSICDWESSWNLPEGLAEAADDRGLSAAEATGRLEVQPHCETPDYAEWFETRHQWTPPPFQIVPEQPMTFDLRVAIMTGNDLGPDTGVTGMFFYPQGVNQERGLLPAPFDPDADGAYVVLLSDTLNNGTPVVQTLERWEDLAQAVWQAPLGKAGDRLALGIYLVGPAGQRLISYEYTLRSYQKGETPVAPVDTAEEPDEPETGPDVEPEAQSLLDTLLGLLPAGFGGIGDIPGPEGLLETLAGVVAPATLIAILSALSSLRGGEPPFQEVGEGLPGPPGPQQLTMTDALGQDFSYEWDPEAGGYINPATGGMLDPTLWNEYNQNLQANQAFIEQQREKLESRDSDFDRQMDQMVADQRAQREMVQQLERLEQAGYGLGEDGARASAHAAELLKRARTGEAVPAEQVAAIDRFVRHRQEGQSAAESELAPVSEIEVYKEGLLGSVRTAITARNPDGSTNWAAIVGRVGLAVATLGQSEWVMTPAESAYVFKDCMDQGQSTTQAVVTAGATALFGLVLGKAAGGVMRAGGWLAGATSRQVGKVFPGLSSYVSKGVKGLGQEFKVLGKWANKAWEGVGNRLGRYLPNTAVKQPLRTVRLQQVNRQVQRALASGDEQAIRNLYRNGGMRELAQLEELGHISRAEADRLNQVLGRNVNQAIKEGTESTIDAFEKRTGVKVKEVLVGDSGSSARGGARSVRTDFDRTGVATFDEATLDAYRRANGVSRAEAERRLSREFAEAHGQQVNAQLRQRGLSAADVDYKTYNRIGGDAGQSDAYATGYTNARQSTIGRTEVYRRGPDGQIRSYATSGDALVDTNNLQTGRMTGRLPADPTRIPAEELPQIIQRQVESAGSHSDVKSLAKALNRADYAGQRMGQGVNPELAKIAQQISDNPQEMNRILQQNGMSAEEFVGQSRQAINDLADWVGA